MSTQFFPLEGCLATAAAIRTALAASVLHLFQSTLAPDPATPTADYTSAEATFAGYAAATITAWNTPILAPGTGYMIGSPLVQFTWVSGGGDVGNIIGGCFLLDSTGKNRLVIIFTTPIPMQLAGQGLPINLIWLFPTGV